MSRRPRSRRTRASSPSQAFCNMSRSTCFAVAMIPFLIIWCGVADGAPFLGLLSLLGASSTNSSSLLSSLFTSHLQAKLNALAIASDLLAMLSNVTAIG